LVDVWAIVLDEIDLAAHEAEKNGNDSLQKSYEEGVELMDCEQK
jgi:hypothetical protein